MATITKRNLSESTHGRGIKVAATSIATGTDIHTSVATTTDGEGDDVTLYAQNSHTSTVTLTIGFGGTTDPDDLIELALDPGVFAVVIPGLVLKNALGVKAAATVADVVTIFGYVLRNN